MNALTPAAQATLDALRDGPADVHEVGERTGRSRSATDMTLPELATAGPVEVGDGDPADGTPTRWRPADNPPAAGSEQPAAGMTDQPEPRGDAGEEKQEPPKRCRGCQAQMPATCPGCGQKTPAHCGTCGRDQPRRRQPQILASGLPRLRPGELPQLVARVMRDNPLPQHLGVTGWTASRVAVYLPGRGTSAIGNALDKLTHAGTAQLIGDQPNRYQLTPPPDDAAESTHG